MRRLGCLIVCLGVLVLGPGAAFGATFGGEEVEFEVTADYFGKYIWRGQNLNDDGAFQPGISATCGNLTLGVWGSVDLTSINRNSGEITEADYSLDYSADIPGLEGVGYSFGLINYVFPNTKVDDTTEVYVGLSFDLPCSPSVTLYSDIDDYEGASYISFAVGHSYENVTELGSDTPVGMDIGLSLGWGSASYNKAYWGNTGTPSKAVTTTELQDLVVSISFPMEIGGWSVAPSVNYVALMSNDIRNADTYNKDSEYLFGGISLSKGF